MSEKQVMDFGELAADTNFTSVMTTFNSYIEKIGECVETACSSSVYEDLSLEEKVKYDLFMAYSVNSLYWLYLRTQGLDPTKHEIKSEIDRVRGYNAKAKTVYDKKHLMPRIDKDAAKRFVRSGLWQPKSKEAETDKTSEMGKEAPTTEQ